MEIPPHWGRIKTLCGSDRRVIVILSTATRREGSRATLPRGRDSSLIAQNDKTLKLWRVSYNRRNSPDPAFNQPPAFSSTHVLPARTTSIVPIDSAEFDPTTDPSGHSTHPDTTRTAKPPN